MIVNFGSAVFFFAFASALSSARAGVIDFRLAVDGIAKSASVDVSSVPGAPNKVALLNVRSGQIRLYDRVTRSLDPTPLLSGVTIPGGDLLNALSLAFAPDFQTSGKVYVSAVGVANGADWNQVLEYTVDVGSMVADVGSARSVMRIEHPVTATSLSHHGSDLNFGPTDGMLYMTFGDSQVPLPGAPGAPAVNPAQDVTTRLGSVLRVDLSGDAYPDDPDNNYAIPPDNPDFGVGADPALWAIGLRNPFRASFSALTGQLIIGDVGEDGWEEINIGVAGGNYGWPAFEGEAAFGGLLAPVGALIGPAYAYSHGPGLFEGRSITGGVVYFGDIEALYGRYIFGDYEPRDGRVSLWTVLLDADGVASDPQVWSYKVDAGALIRPMAFSTMEDGALFVSGQNGDVYELTAVMVPAPASAGPAVTGLALLLGVGWRRRPGRAAAQGLRHHQ